MEKRILLEKRGREANQVRKAFRHSYILPIFLIYRYDSLSQTQVHSSNHQNAHFSFFIALISLAEHYLHAKSHLWKIE